MQIKIVNFQNSNGGPLIFCKNLRELLRPQHALKENAPKDVQK